MKSVCVMSYTDPTRNPRPNRMVRLLKNHYKVTVIGLGSGNIENIEFVPIPSSSFKQKARTALGILTRNFPALALPESLEWVAKQLEQHRFDLVVTHDLSLMPLAVRIHKGAPILLDAREYYPKNFEDRFVWRLFSQPLYNYLCAQYLRIPDSIITVSEGIALEYEKVFQVKPEVVMSLPDFIDLAPTPTDPQKIRMIHHGNATPSRRLEGMIEMMDYVDSRFFLDLMLVGNSRDPYLKKLQKLAGFRPNVRIIPPVTLQELVRFTNAYDIGLCFLPPTNFNLQHTLPNKFFEFIQARLMVAIGPSIEMIKIVKEFDCGIVAKDFNSRSLAQDLNRLDAPRIDYYKRQADLAARSLNSEESNRKIIEIVQNLI